MAMSSQEERLNRLLAKMPVNLTSAQASRQKDLSDNLWKYKT